MTGCAVDDIHIVLDRKGAREFLKLSVPMRHGRYHEVRTPEYLIQFNLNAEVKYVMGRHSEWPHPAEWMKRTLGNDWVYYSVGSYSDVFDLTGEYYFPCLSYDENPFFRQNPFMHPSVRRAVSELDGLRETLGALYRQALPVPVKTFLRWAAAADTPELKRRAGRLHRILGEPLTILPPDARHVDYSVIPTVIARGCLYHCGFCRFKTRDSFTPLSRDAVMEQMRQMKAFLGKDLPNYNAVFFGQHDALSVGTERLLFAAEKAYAVFEQDRSYLTPPHLFFFGSVDGMLGAEESLFEALNRLPYRTYINLGLESMDPGTLHRLKKPVSVGRVQEAFVRMLEVNRRYPDIEVTANFVVGNGLSERHLSSLLEFLQRIPDRICSKGSLYVSPLHRREPKRQILAGFHALKRSLRLPAYVYIAQRL